MNPERAFGILVWTTMIVTWLLSMAFVVSQTAIYLEIWSPT